jgi:hypothetical protein
MTGRTLLAFRAWRPLAFGAVNWRGLWALYYGLGVSRFLRFGLETLAGPLVSSLLFLLVFVVTVSPIGTSRLKSTERTLFWRRSRSSRTSRGASITARSIDSKKKRHPRRQIERT